MKVWTDELSSHVSQLGKEPLVHPVIAQWNTIKTRTEDITGMVPNIPEPGINRFITIIYTLTIRKKFAKEG